MTVEKEYYINVTEQQKEKFCLSLHYNESSNYIFVNGVEIYKLKSKDSEKDVAPLWIENVSKYFPVDNMKKTGLYGYVYDSSLDYDVTAIDDI